MWRRLRRRSFAPNRPAVWPEQWGLVLLTVVALALAFAAVVTVLTRA